MGAGIRNDIWAIMTLMKPLIELNGTILNLIAEIDEFKGGWKYLHFLRPDALEKLRRVATIESVGSSTRIEGAKLFPPF